MKHLNKKAGEKILSIWWFACLALVGAAVVLVVTTYFGAFVDTRNIETTILQEKIMDCITQNGYLREESLILTRENLFEKCNLNSNQFTDNSPFLINLTIYNSNKKEKVSILEGQISYQEDCLVVAGKKAPNYPLCIQSKEDINYWNSVTKEIESWSIYLLVASNNKGYKESIIKTEVKPNEI